MKSIDSAIRKTILDLNIPAGKEEQVRKVIMEYWEDIYLKVVSGRFTAVSIRHVGTLVMSRYKLNRLIINQIKKIRRVKKSKKFTDETKQVWLDNYYGKLRLALKQRNEIAIQYAEIFGNI